MAPSPIDNPKLIKFYWILLILCTIAAAFFQDPIIVQMEGEGFNFQSAEQLAKSEPQPLNLVSVYDAIVYPPECHEANIQGEVKLRILVDTSGKPIRHEVVSSPHELLLKACEDVIYDLQFKPALKAGKPIESWITIPFNFEAVKQEVFS
jgi:TonB family protein